MKLSPIRISLLSLQAPAVSPHVILVLPKIRMPGCGMSSYYCSGNTYPLLAIVASEGARSSLAVKLRHPLLGDGHPSFAIATRGSPLISAGAPVLFPRPGIIRYCLDNALL